MIDDNVNLVEMVKDYFENHPKIEIVGSANDGMEGLNIIKEGKLKYDLIVLYKSSSSFSSPLILFFDFHQTCFLFIFIKRLSIRLIFIFTL